MNKVKKASVRCLMALACLLLPWGAVGQSVSWTLFSEGTPVPWTASRTWPADSVNVVALEALSSLQSEGYLFAQIDSFEVGQNNGVLYATLGPAATIASVRIVGAISMDSTVLWTRLESQPGQPFSTQGLERDAQRLVDVYTTEGYHLVRVMVGELTVISGQQPRVSVTFQVHEGLRSLLQAVELHGAKRTRVGFVRRLIEVKLGSHLPGFDPVAVQKRLQEIDIFSEVGSPTLALGPDSTMVLQIPIVEAPPGVFDLALGYERNDAGRGALVGSGHLAIRNLFGKGRVLSMMLNRTPGQVSKLSIQAHDPFVLGAPISLGIRFNGLQQDSTYGKRDYELEVGYRFEGLLHVFATLTREVTRPGLTGLQITGDQQRIPLATALFAGVGLRVRTLDSRINPIRGFVVETEVESGSKLRTLRVVREDTTEETTRLRQARLSARARLFIPTARRQTLVFGGETVLLASRQIDESDLFRFGGANSLRGYDEDRFRVPFAARLLVEYRYLLDEASHALAFVDLGYVDAWHAEEPFRGFYPGFGVGFQMNTAAGLITVTAAASTETPSEVRAHLGISLGL